MAVWILALAVLGPRVSRADATAEAKALFRKAERHFAKGEFRPALELYQQAYEKKPLPGFYFNIGQCHRSLGEHRQAIEAFQKYLDSPNPKFKSDAERLIELSKQDLEKQRALEPKDEEPPDLRPAPPPQPVPPPQPAPPSEKPSRRRLSPIYFWSGVGLTGAMLLTCVITGSLALSKSSTFNDASTPYEDLQDLKDSGESMRTAANVTLGLGLVAAAGTTVLYFFTDFDSKETRVSGAPLPGGAVLSMTGEF